MREFIENVISTFSFSDVLTIISGGVAVISAIVSYFNKIQAKKSEESAKYSAALADEFYKSAKEYYDRMNKGIDDAINKQKEDDKKQKVYKFICEEGFTNTERVASVLGITKNEAYEILIELLQVDRVISCGGSAKKENMDNVVWMKNKK